MPHTSFRVAQRRRASFFRSRILRGGCPFHSTGISKRDSSDTIHSSNPRLVSCFKDPEEHYRCLTDKCGDTFLKQMHSDFPPYRAMQDDPLALMLRAISWMLAIATYAIMVNWVYTAHLEYWDGVYGVEEEEEEGNDCEELEKQEEIKILLATAL